MGRRADGGQFGYQRSDTGTVLGRIGLENGIDVPKSRSSISRDNDTPQVQNSIGAVADTIVSAADEVVEGLGDLMTPTAQGDDYAETAWQRKLRNQASRKKKRRRGL